MSRIRSFRAARPAALVALGGALAAAVACASNGGPAAGASAGVSAPAAPGALPLKHAPRPTERAITAGDLMTRLYIFADDSMMGREAGTEGNLKGAAYIAGELQRLGLQPAGENGGWFQDVPLVRRGVAADAAIRVDGQALARGADWAPSSARGTLKPLDGSYATVFAGPWVGTTALTREQVAGKLVVFTANDGTGAPTRIQPDSPLAAAAGVVVVGLDRVPAGMRGNMGAPFVALPAGGAASAPVPQLLLVTAAAAERMLGAAPASLQPGAAGRTVEARVRLEETPAPGRNVVAILPGSDPALRGTYVAVGAHNDHVGYSRPALDHDSLKTINELRRRLFVSLDTDGDDVLTPEQQTEYNQQARAVRVNVDSLRRIRPARLDSINNGADDDGSGSMALLEIAEAMATAPSKPRRSVLFVWHTAEEKGLLGARWYTAHTTVPRDSIVAQVNIDMIGRGAATEERNGGQDYVGLIGPQRLSTQFEALAQSVNRAQPRPLVLDRALDRNGHPQNIYCRSDHYEYAKYGIPVAFFFTGLHGDYHQLTDEPQYIDYPKYARITRYLHDLTRAVADRGERLPVDGPKPDPNGVCRQ